MIDDRDRLLLETMRDRTRFQQALRRIVSLGEKNVPKYAQEIARDALKGTNRSEHEPVCNGTRGPFICGTVGAIDTGGLHDGYVICPQVGSDYVAVFMQKRADK
jgi:hypothetical protein